VFEGFTDYVFDVKWSPKHPAVFATGDATGEITLWNLNVDVEVPIAKEKISDHGINCLNWSPDGKRLVVGDTEGILYLIELPETVRRCLYQSLSRGLVQPNKLRLCHLALEACSH